MKKTHLVLILGAVFLAPYASAAAGSTQLVSGQTYTDTEGDIYSPDESLRVENVTLKGNSQAFLSCCVLAEGFRLYDKTYMLVNASGESGLEHAIQNTAVYDQADLHLDSGAISRGTLFIDKNASLYLSTTDDLTIDVTSNAPAPAKSVYVENLNLAGLAEIGPTWIDGEDGDAPPLERPGPSLVTRIDNLQMQPGSKLYMSYYKSGMQFNRLELKNLSGSGTFGLSARLDKGIADQIHVSEKATGKFDLFVYDFGKEIDKPQDVQLVYINSGDATFDLANDNGVVEAGVYQYKLHSVQQDGHTTWTLVGAKPGEAPVVPAPTPTPDQESKPTPVPEPDQGNNLMPTPGPNQGDSAGPGQHGEPVPAPQPRLSHSARAVLNLAAAPRQVLTTELDALRQRQHGVHRQTEKSGVWAQYLNDTSHLNDHHNSAFSSSLNGLQLGVDRQFENEASQWLFGAFATYSKTTLDFDRAGEGHVRSYGGGVYAGWQADNGLYADTVFKVNHMSNLLRGRTNSGSRVSGSYTQNAFSTALETGYVLPITTMFTLTPYAALNYARIGDADYRLSHGMTASLPAMNSLQGELGTVLHAKFDFAGQILSPYARLAIACEFRKHHDVTINGIELAEYYGGNVGKYGLGINADVTGNARLFAEINYQNGNKVETPLNATAGFQFLF